MLNGVEIRLSRLFNQDEKAVIIAVDHGEFDGPIKGMENLPEVVRKISPDVDGVLVSPGMLLRCAHAFDYKGAPMAVVRLNWSTIYCFDWGYDDGSTVQAISARDAAAAGADVALVSLTLQTGCQERDARNVELYARLVQEAHDVGLPVVGEIFPPEAEKLSGEEMYDKVLKGCRIAAELGADMIKTFYTPNFRTVANGCPIPIFGLGARKLPTQAEALALAQQEVEDGCGGVVFGRNAIQVPDPAAFQNALCDVVKRGVTAAEAARKYNLHD